LSDELVAAALDRTQSSGVRWQAARAVDEIGPDAARDRLLPILEEAPGDDSADHLLRAHALRVLWLRRLTTAELLEDLARNKVSSGDEYAPVVERRLLEELAGSDIVAALGWVAARAAQDDGPLQLLIEGIVEVAANRLAAEGVTGALARAMVGRVRPRAYVVVRKTEDIAGALRTQAEIDRERLADALAAEVRDSWDCYDISRWMARLELPFEVVLDRVEGATGPAAFLWTEALTTDPRLRERPSVLDELRAAADRAVDPAVGARLAQVEEFLGEARPSPEDAP
jgi:hypothetical protein